MSKGKTLRLLTVGLVLILSASVVRAGGLHFGMIKGVEDRIEKLNEKIKKEEKLNKSPVVDSLKSDSTTG